jgi:hypothetical protein
MNAAVTPIQALRWVLEVVHRPHHRDGHPCDAPSLRPAVHDSGLADES